ncbi:hypothetical protein [Dactylosporangium sp. CA-233914]|uniref:hypothetical protein n=1 Tax=Dactylosporangium sp. CA-233914 TaxID=3239934 RepID=UPI003D8CA542
MGLFVRINAFRGVGHADVHAALAEFWSRHARRVEQVPADEWVDAFNLYEQRDGWTVMRWTSGWEWTLRRQAQLHVSEALGCAGILVFVYDGDDWGYELFDRGTAVDWFIQWPQERNTWFPGRDLSGRPEAVVAAFPDLALDRSDVAAYLVQRPDDEESDDAWDVPARAGDRFRRGDECAALDFLALLGVTVAVTEEGLGWPAPLWRRFRVEPPPADVT